MPKKYKPVDYVGLPWQKILAVIRKEGGSMHVRDLADSLGVAADDPRLLKGIENLGSKISKSIGKSKNGAIGTTLTVPKINTQDRPARQGES